MISKEELFDTLNELLGGDLSEGAVEYVANALLEKFVMFERPSVGNVEETEDGGISLDGRKFPVYSLSKVEEWYQDCLKNAESELSGMLEAWGVLGYYRKAEQQAKAKRREELAQELCGSTLAELPGMTRTLIWRLVEAELKNARN